MISTSTLKELGEFCPQGYTISQRCNSPSLDMQFYHSKGIIKLMTVRQTCPEFRLESLHFGRHM